MAQPRITVSSKDGVPISVIKVGSGPAMVMVHGSASVALSWAPVLPELRKKFTLYVMDRRGRAPSGDGSKYSVEAEVDDIAAVIAAAGQPVTLLAHSYGAFLAVVGAARGEFKEVSRMILYEPPVYQEPRAARLQEIREAAAAGDYDRVATLFLSGIVDGETLSRMRALPAVWAGLVAIAGTLPREVEAVNNTRVSAAALAKWDVQTTMLSGDKSPEILQDAANYVCTSMANCKLVKLAGQGHVAAQQAPALFVSKVLEASGQ
jgi:pimeloyl-ACP methyl ester carboxylesterase